MMAEEHVIENSEIENDEMEDWNDDMIEEMVQSETSQDSSLLTVYSRDWTVATIDLFPKR